MNLAFIINQALTIPPHIFIKKVYYVLLRKLRHIVKKKKDYIFATYLYHNNIKIEKHYINIANLHGIDSQNLKAISKYYIEHRFDLLGSGWVKNNYNSLPLGVEGNKYDQNENFDLDNLVLKPNTKYSKEIYSLVDKEYEAIDWQKDFKSGFRWSTKDWYLNQRNSISGVDIKVPWEIGRLQHLPQLALACVSSYDELLIREFKNQILDFIALNPPRFGVQWTCTMDVGIRVANMLLAYDIFKQLDQDTFLDKEFDTIFSHSIYDHAIHIVNNFEYRENLTSNHYLSNIVGLLFASTYLQLNDETNRWLAFSVQEIISEMKKQFYEEGSNFEASTSYHRLSSELMLYATALIVGLDKDKCHALQNYINKSWRARPILRGYDAQEYKIVDNRVELPQWFIDRLYRAGQFTQDITKSNGEIVQFGDNDSGRFFRLSPNGEWLETQKAIQKYKNLENYPLSDEKFWDENILNHQTLISGMGGLFDEKCFENEFIFEKLIVEILAKGRKLAIIKKSMTLQPQRSDSFEALKYQSKKHFEVEGGKQSLIDNITLIAYPETGIYILKSDQIYLAIWAGSNGQKGNGGHAHNDKLSFELSLNGIDVIIDAGTYIYTPLPDRRNQFRSTKAHNTLVVEGVEQNEWLEGRYGLFSMKNQSKCYLLDFGDNFIDVALEYRGIKQRRKFIVEKEQIVIENYSNRKFNENYNDFKLYSNGYGKWVNS